MTSRGPERAARRAGVGRRLVLAATAALVAAPLACVSPDSGGLTVRLSIATGGTGGVYYPYGGGIAKIISEHVEGVEATAEVTAGTVDNLKFIASRSADLAFGLADSIDDAANQRGAFADFGVVPMRALAVLYDNYNHLVSVTATGIETVADLEGRVVSTGAPGSGREVSAFRILEAAGVDPDTGIRKQSLGAAQSVDAIKDDKIDAFFFSGGLPTGAILDLASTPGRTIKVVPNGETLATLQGQYGSLVYHNSPIPPSTYPGMEETVTVVAVSNVLVVHEAMDAELAYELTRVLFEQHEELAAVHPMAAILTLESATAGSPIPFHDGAERYYRERGAWSE
ncbi:MAG: TAXI family TRAP transporter solute-binding subunit [Acidobacteria bacterium]|nr:TAXI family TRAP transporter solute-binding subunit [Acidobacteriota bacterium]